MIAYRAAAGANPSFGELALMYSKPRAASIYALTDGILWGLDRRVFRKLLIRTNRSSLIQALRRVDILKALSSIQIQRLCDIMSEVKYKTGEHIIRQDEMGDTFYIILEGTVKATKNGVKLNLLEMKENDYFGERALLRNEPRYVNLACKCNAPGTMCTNCYRVTFSSTGLRTSLPLPSASACISERICLTKFSGRFMQS